MAALGYHRTDAEQALRLIFTAYQEDRPYTLFDVRDAHTFGHGHIPTAQQLGEHDVGHWVRKLPRTQPVFIYCSRGFSSQTFAKTFADFGFSEVYSIDGGFPALLEAFRAARQAAENSAAAPV
ncbi:MAG TPA: rhodanese-like domain-containing protein [Polyangiaceae bacterium]|nr:rhodanese-like domain-containing protein [Polyangiaceae bacterium]